MFGKRFYKIAMMDVLVKYVFPWYQVLAHGLLFGNEPYLRKGWNCLDGFLVLLSWIDFILSLSTKNTQTDVFKALRVLRALRSLRPLR